MDMDNVQGAISRLKAEHERIAKAIAILQQMDPEVILAYAPHKRSKQGRKSMGAEERRQVSARMRKYWADRRTNDQDQA